MAKVWMMWHGGASYAAPDPSNREDCEPFASLRDAREDFASRPGARRYPGCEDVPPSEGGPEGWILYADPFECGDVDPDRVLSFGPRGGVRTSPG